jgi:hypothetical protein
MARQQQTPSSAKIPPDVPADPAISTALTQYLRNFSVWCREGFADSFRNKEALRGIMLRGYDTPPGANPAVWMLEVAGSGQLGVAPMKLGSVDDPGTFVPIGSGAYLPLTGGTVTGNVTVIAQVNAKAAAGGNAAFAVMDSAGTTKGYFYWENTDGTVRMYSVAGNNALSLLTNGSLSYLQGGTTRFSIDASGNVSANGQIVSNTNLFALQGNVYSRQAGAGSAAVFQMQNTAGAALAQTYWEPSDSTVRMWHNSGQFAGVAATGFLTNGTIKAGTGYQCKRGNAGVYSNLFNYYWNASAMEQWVDNVNTGVVTVTSDYRTKKDVEDLGSTWDLVKDLRPIRYTQAEFSPPSHLREDEEVAPLFAADDVERWGFIAHELQETLIESAATGVKDQPDLIQSPNPWTVIAALTKTVQELQARVEALEA